MAENGGTPLRPNVFQRDWPRTLERDGRGSAYPSAADVSVRDDPDSRPETVPYANRLKRHRQPAENAAVQLERATAAAAAAQTPPAEVDRSAARPRCKRDESSAGGRPPFSPAEEPTECVRDRPAAVPSLPDFTRDLQAITEEFVKLRLNNDDDDDPEEGDLKKLRDMTAVDFNVDRYARHGVHETEIKDYVRTVTFMNSIEYCVKRKIKDKVVLVVRCGIGLLPMLCVRIGLAKKVIALEQSSCIEYARRIIKDNLYSEQITLIQSSVHDLETLPHSLTQVDVIVSDFIGECVLGQGNQMEQVIEARDRFLKPNGLMIPMCVTLYGQLLEQKRTYENRRIRKNKKKNKEFDNYCVHKSNVDQAEDTEEYNSDSSSDSTWCSWWKDVYGFDMRSKEEFIVLDNSVDRDHCNSGKEKWCIMPEPLFAHFDPFKVVSNACLIKKFNMHECTINDVRHVQCEELKLVCATPFTSANGGDYAHIIELFMVVDFPDGQKVNDKNKKDANIGFSTSSFSPFTRFKQTGLLLRDQLTVDNGDEFTINEFIMWRGPQQNQRNKLFDAIISKNISQKTEYEENLKLRLRYTFVNKHTKAVNRRCAYTLTKYIF